MPLPTPHSVAAPQQPSESSLVDWYAGGTPVTAALDLHGVDPEARDRAAKPLLSPEKMQEILGDRPVSAFAREFQEAADHHAGDTQDVPPKVDRPKCCGAMCSKPGPLAHPLSSVRFHSALTKQFWPTEGKRT